MYVDGSQDTSEIYPWAHDMSMNGPSVVSIGGYSDEMESFEGLIAEVRIWCRAQTQHEIEKFRHKRCAVLLGERARDILDRGALEHATVWFEGLV